MTTTSLPRSRAIRLALLPLAAVVALLGAACGSESSAASAGSTVTPQEAMDLLDEQPDAVVIDVRTPAEYAAGHLPDAQLLDIQSPDFAAGLDELDPDGTYIVYCRSGNRSAAATAAMVDAGFTDVHDLGGIGDWASAGGGVVTD